jgi:type VI secretion system secreted protein VgrG
MEITTPLGEDVLLFHAMNAREELSRVGECRLDLLSAQDDIDVDQILGKNVTVKVALQDDGTRFFNGFVTRFGQGGKHGRYRRYYADVHPWMWFLSRTTDCRIFQEMTVPDIVKKVFSDHPIALFADELTGTYRSWTYCVQYRETDLNFVCRLLEHEGIYFYFKHEAGKHTLVLADSYSGHEPCQAEPIPFIAPDDLARPDIEHVSAWTMARAIQPGVYAQNDYDFERPSVALRTKKPVSRGYTPSDYEVYDYPGCYVQKADGEQLAAVRINEYAAQFQSVQAVTNVKTVGVGGLFKLERCPRADQNAEHLVVSATYDLQFSDYEAMPERSGAEYRCSFSAMPSQQEFRPRRLTPKPFMQGPQTAVVVGPAGDEIYTDKYGRIKVQFHWDRYGQRDENSSCWIRVSQTWAGKGWGSVVIPRIEQEVIVDFLEGDPDQPIVTGCVYNGSNLPPTALPDAGVISGLKSNTHKGRGFNEMTMDDTAGKEKINIHAQYDMDTTVEHDQTSKIINNRSTNVVVDDTLNVDANRTMHVKAKLAETVDGGQEVTVSAGYKETITGGATSDITGGLTSTVNDGQTSTINGKWDSTVNGHLKEEVSSGAELTVTGALSQSATGTLDIHAGGAGTYTSDTSLKFAVAGSVIEITPGGITISLGGSSVKVDPAGVTVMGPKISLNG